MPDIRYIRKVFIFPSATSENHEEYLEGATTLWIDDDGYPQFDWRRLTEKECAELEKGNCPKWSLITAKL
jgi:hypothetical protein